MAIPPEFTALVAAGVALTDADLDRFCREEAASEAEMVDTLVAAGYAIGRDADGRNDYWPPEPAAAGRR